MWEKITVMAMLITPFAFGFETWYGYQGIYQINTELDVGGENSGYWYDYDDSKAGGKSLIKWPASKGNEYADDAMDPIIDYCGGICGSYKLQKDSMKFDPYVGIGFNMGGEDENGFAIPVDASTMEGICVAFYSDNNVSIEMGLDNKKEAALVEDVPMYPLGKSTTGIIKKIPWSEFKQEGWGKSDGGETITGEEAASILASLRFKFQGKDGTTGGFNILSVGKLEGNCQDFTYFVKPSFAYNIRFINGNLVLKTYSVESGNIPEYDGEEPTKPASKDYTYEFVGWTPAIVPANYNADYYALFDSTKTTSIVGTKQNAIHIEAKNRSLYFEGVTPSTKVAVFNTQGQIIYNGFAKNGAVKFNKSGAYIVRVGIITKMLLIK